MVLPSKAMDPKNRLYRYMFAALARRAKAKGTGIGK